jgi:TRAP-type C4-dicarboxylate transport system substrate-binding protein
VFNKDKYNQMSAAQKKVIDNHCTNEWALKVAAPWADFEHGGIAKLKAEAGHEVYGISPEQVAEWRKASAPLEASWAASVKKAGVDSDAAMKELKASLTQYKAAF